MVTETRIAQAKEPLLGQHDLRNLRVAAARVLDLSGVAHRLGRSLSRAELQLLDRCAAVVAIIQGQLGEDLDGEPVGDLTLRPQPGTPAVYRPKLSGNGQ